MGKMDDELRKIEAFLAYEEVREGGETNMLDRDRVCELAGITRDEYMDIIENYKEYAKKYLPQPAKAFISQPMAGRDRKEIMEERERAREELLNLYPDGVEVMDTYFPEMETYFPVGDDPLPLKTLAKSIDMLADADVAYFCHGWENARGCRIEHECVVEYGIGMTCIER